MVPGVSLPFIPNPILDDFLAALIGKPGGR